jgi:hypothetical protein
VTKSNYFLRGRAATGDSRQLVEEVRIAFSRKWKPRSQALSASFEEAGDELTGAVGPISLRKGCYPYHLEIGGPYRPAVWLRIIPQHDDFETTGLLDNLHHVSIVPML